MTIYKIGPEKEEVINIINGFEYIHNPSQKN